ncbi:protein FAM204A-like [Argiope bruennichi]|uniref:Protein FAM204A like protein n=1 Tax=Argiope bruennichi TaxID=94029 RepID=A0A8T0EAQ8_ARGBR|nr:protein FAM204A-like [Argiope bruennichi]KAF8767531.1 Protein FAM204A like protein [Argiope bruennichi]
MVDSNEESSDSDLDDINWFAKKRKQGAKSSFENAIEPSFTDNKHSEDTVSEKNKKFEELQKKAEQIRLHSARRREIAEKRRAKQLIKKALRDPLVKHLVEKEKCSSNNNEEASEKKEQEQWNEVKPYLNINSHLQGPVSHGDWGPKNEIETMINDAIKEGDFEKAELLSDTLANKQFAGKICKAFAAKREYDVIEEQKSIEKAKKPRKIRWIFEAKEKWQMKGNM